MGDFIREYAGFLLQILPCAFYCFYPFTNKLKYSRTFNCIVVLTITLVMAAIGVGAYALNIHLSGYLFNDSYILTEISFLIAVLLLLIFFHYAVNASIYKQLFVFSIVAIYGFIIEETLRIIITVLIQANLLHYPEGALYPPISIIGYIIFNIVLYYPMTRLLNLVKKDFNNKINASIWRKIYLVPLGFFIFLLVMYDLPYVLAMNIRLYQAIFIIPITIFIFGVLFWVFRIIQVHQRQLEQEARLKLQIQSYQQKINNSKQLREIRHEIKHTITALRLLIDNKNYDEAENYLNRFSERVDQSVIVDDLCENALLNSLLLDYKQKSASKGISINFDVEINPEFEMDEVDMVEFLTNMLDNAIEACMLNSQDDQTIKLVIRQNNNFLLVKCSNNYEPENLIKQNNIFITNKEKSSFKHGHGLKIMRNIAEKYNGILRINTDQNIFTVSSNLCLK